MPGDVAPFPEHIKPMLARLDDLPADESAWAFEVKWDGMRAIAFIDDGELRLETRTGNDVTRQYPELADLATSIHATRAVLDGEIVTFDEHGHPSFQALQSRLGLSAPATIARRAAQTPVTYLAFDVLHLEGHDVSTLPYEQRRALLRGVFANDVHWQVPVHHVGDGSALLDAVVEQGMEGIVAKRLGSPYNYGARTGDWRKIKRQQRQEFVVGGWTDGAGRRAGTIGALLIGYHDESGQLVYAGSVGSGLSGAIIEQLTPQLSRLARVTSPFDVNSPGDVIAPGRWQSIAAKGARHAHFVTPKLVVDVEFSEFTRDGRLRHPTFIGMRNDKAPADVVREEPAS